MSLCFISEVECKRIGYRSHRLILFVCVYAVLCVPGMCVTFHSFILSLCVCMSVCVRVRNVASRKITYHTVS